MISKLATRRVSAIALSVALGSGTLEGCNKPAAPAAPNAATALALPLTTGDATPVTPAPSVADLPPAPRPRIVRVRDPSQRYAYVDQAYAMSRAIGRAPPDYGFDYQGARPWVWRTSANAMRLVEPIEGGYRSYYYQPGADAPYLVRDPQYSYGFADGQLVTVYAAGGRVLDPDEIDRQADWAGRYLERGRALYYAAQRNARESVIAANWQARRDGIDAARAQWEADQSRDDDWRAYHAQHEADEDAYWQGERDRRQQYAQGYDAWSQRSFQGPPPPAYSWGAPPQGGYGGGGIAPAIVGAGAVAGLLAVYGQGHHGGGGDQHASAQQPQPQQPQGASAQQARTQQAQFDATREAQAQDQMRARQAQGRQQQQQADAGRLAAQQARQQAIVQAHQQQQADAGRAAAQQAQQRAQQKSLMQARQQQQQVDSARVAQARAQLQQQQMAEAARGRQQADAVRQAQQQGAIEAERRQAQDAAAARAGAQAQAQAQAGAQAQAAARAAGAQAARAAQAQAATRNAQAAQAQAARAKGGGDPAHRPHGDRP